LLNSRHQEDDSQLSGFECELLLSPLVSFGIWAAGFLEISWGAADGPWPGSSIHSQGKSLSTKNQVISKKASKIAAPFDSSCLPLAKRFCAKSYQENDKTVAMAPLGFLNEDVKTGGSTNDNT